MSNTFNLGDGKRCRAAATAVEEMLPAIKAMQESSVVWTESTGSANVAATTEDNIERLMSLCKVVEEMMNSCLLGCDTINKTITALGNEPI